jgi:hypothetical protein
MNSTKTVTVVVSKYDTYGVFEDYGDALQVVDDLDKAYGVTAFAVDFRMNDSTRTHNNVIGEWL